MEQVGNREVYVDPVTYVVSRQVTIRVPIEEFLDTFTELGESGLVQMLGSQLAKIIRQ